MAAGSPSVRDNPAINSGRSRFRTERRGRKQRWRRSRRRRKQRRWIAGAVTAYCDRPTFWAIYFSAHCWAYDVVAALYDVSAYSHGKLHAYRYSYFQFHAYW